MKYWDTSGVAALLIRDAHTDAALAVARKDRDITTWWGTLVECQSAIWNGERRGSVTMEGAQAAEARLRQLEQDWQEIAPSEAIRQHAARLLRVHELRAADALQLAAALTAAQGRPESLPLLTFDRRLASAAEREGFAVIAPG